jgi:hypothetical protein
MSATETFLTTADLAKRWQISANTLRNWRFRGIGPRYFKPSGERGKALYRLDVIEAWEEKNTIGGDV